MNEELRKQLIDLLAGLMFAEHMGDVGKEIISLSAILDIELEGWFDDWTDEDVAKVGYPREGEQK